MNKLVSYPPADASTQVTAFMDNQFLRTDWTEKRLLMRKHTQEGRFNIVKIMTPGERVWPQWGKRVKVLKRNIYGKIFKILLGN